MMIDGNWREARLAATRSPAFMAGYRDCNVWVSAQSVCPNWDDLDYRGEYLSGWLWASDDCEFDRDARRDPIHRRPSTLSALERNRP